MISTQCWVHPSPSKNGYAFVYTGGTQTSAHRASYEALVGPIPAGLDLDHLCRNRACYNPSHLEPVARAENIRRGLLVALRPPHCPAGHPRCPENNRPKAAKRGGYDCRPCHNDQERARYSRKLLDLSIGDT